MTAKTISISICLMISFACLTGCAAHNADFGAQDEYGFFSGIWHGLVFPFALVTNIVSWIASLFGFSLFESIAIIGRPNTGVGYYVGFALGIGAYSQGKT